MTGVEPLQELSASLSSISPNSPAVSPSNTSVEKMPPIFAALANIGVVSYVRTYLFVPSDSLEQYWNTVFSLLEQIK